jgi:hypothetical protein
MIPKFLDHLKILHQSTQQIKKLKSKKQRKIKIAPMLEPFGMKPVSPSF